MGAPGDADQAREGFWLVHLRTGFAVVVVEALAIMAYLLATPHGPHRRAQWLMSAATLVVGVLMMANAPAWAARRWWRVGFSFMWTLCAIGAIAAAAALDGGIASPLLALLVLPVVFAGLAAGPRVTAACGLASVVAVLVVDGISTSHVSQADVFMRLAALVGVSLLALASSRNRRRLERHQRRLARQLAQQATIDSLTGCWNRRAFSQRLAQEIQRAVRHHRPLSIAMIDVDHFKSVNDQWGHLVGDDLLAWVGASLQGMARATDIVGRLGGDEFVVLMPDTNPAAAVNQAVRLRHALPGDAPVPVTLSVGIAGLDRNEPTAEALLRTADASLYEIKRSGRDGIGLVETERPVARRVG
ncbi:MAG TPA: GGDEF domain-containing protein [Acidimicrobiales bacterium]|nr:GGDEF domain-containing protein [Acidimicrobiales bacterium]